MTRRQAGILVRISDDKAADAAGVARQEADCRALAERHEWDVAEVYVENDTSAFKRRTVRLPDGSTGLRVLRPAFRRLLDDVATGAIDAVIGYDLDRVARDPRDLEDLIDVVERTKVPTKAVTGSLDLSNDSGVTMARVMVAVANKSSRDTARRVSRKHAELAASGRTGGGGIRSFGYQRDGRTLDPVEAAALCEMAKMALAGASLGDMAKWLDGQGIPPVQGGERWNRRSVHTALTKPRNAGLRVYQGEIVGKAEWPAILPEDTWREVMSILNDRRTGTTNVLKRWLSGVLLCGHCGKVLQGAQSAYGGRYWCNSSKGGCGRIAVNQPKAEEAVEAMLLGYLARPDVMAELRAEGSSRTSDRAREELKADQQQLKDLASLWAARSITTDEYMQARGDIQERVAGWSGVLRAALPEPVRVLASGDVERKWSAMTARQRQQVAKCVFPSGIRVQPSEGNRFRGFDVDRLVPLDWQAS